MSEATTPLVDVALDGLARLTVALAADALDVLGRRDQVMDEGIRPIAPGRRVAGWARTVEIRETDVMPEEPYLGEMAAIAGLRTGDLPVYSVESRVRAAVFGELFGVAARTQGAVGAIVDGHARDIRQLREYGFPVFSRGVCAYDTRGRAEVTAIDEEIVCGGVAVTPGDLVIADDDGVVVVPRSLVTVVLEEATSRLADEHGARADLVGGASVREVWDKWHVF